MLCTWFQKCDSPTPPEVKLEVSMDGEVVFELW
jgi:hypothetical protein